MPGSKEEGSGDEPRARLEAAEIIRRIEAAIAAFDRDGVTFEIGAVRDAIIELMQKNPDAKERIELLAKIVPVSLRAVELNLRVIEASKGLDEFQAVLAGLPFELPGVASPTSDS